MKDIVQDQLTVAANRTGLSRSHNSRSKKIQAVLQKICLTDVHNGDRANCYEAFPCQLLKKYIQTSEAYTLQSAPEMLAPVRGVGCHGKGADENIA